jgi:glyoxylase-like metal-dependent hydrolase (beta-lactamase superfamily II)
LIEEVDVAVKARSPYQSGKRIDDAADLDLHSSGVHYVAAAGHSPSHATILFTSGNEQFMHMGDIAHNPVTSLQHPDWTPIFDYEPAQAIKSRKAILDRVATDRIVVMGYHFPFP